MGESMISTPPFRTSKRWIAIRIALPGLLTVALFAMATFWIALPTLRRNLMESKKTTVHDMTDLVWTLLEHYQQRVEAGEFSVAEGQMRVAERIRAIRYGEEGKDYFWINDTLPRIIMHPYRTDLEGTDVSNFTDPHGKRLFSAFVDLVRRQGAGFEDYMWQWKDDSTRVVPKISYVRLFKPWGWVVGTGIYIEDVRHQIATLSHKAARLFGAMLFLVLLLSGISIWRTLAIERRRAAAELALKESEQRYREFLEHANSLIMRWSPDGVISYVNPFAERCFGYEPDTLLGQNAYDRLFVDASGPRARWNHHRVGDTALQERICENRRLSGETVWIHWFPQVVLDEGGLPREYLMVGNDVTQRLATEAAVERLRSHLQNVINAMPSALIGVDGEGNVVQWNHLAEAIDGFDAASAQGRRLDAAVPQLDLLTEPLQETLRLGKVYSRPRVRLKLDGQLCWTDITLYPLGTAPEDGAAVRVDDITQRIQMEEVMIQSAKMLSVGGLAAGMAHEINNPLSGILQNMQVILNRLDPDFGKNRDVAQESGIDLNRLQEYLVNRGITEMMQWITDSGRRAARIVDNMLSFSRKSQSEFQILNVAELLDRTLELAASDYHVGRRYDFKKITIHKDYLETVPSIRAEPGLLQQVFLNILLNGAQALAEFQQPEPAFLLRITADEAWVNVEIADNGPGMDAQQVQRVFDPFYTTKPVGSGTGLGLSVSYFIITEQHGGRLSVKATPEQGATFIIQLPRAVD